MVFVLRMRVIECLHLQIILGLYLLLGLLELVYLLIKVLAYYFLLLILWHVLLLELFSSSLGMIDGVINNGRRGEELEKAKEHAERTQPEKKPSIRERLEDAKKECSERKPPEKGRSGREAPEHSDL